MCLTHDPSRACGGRGTGFGRRWPRDGRPADLADRDIRLARYREALEAGAERLSSPGGSARSGPIAGQPRRNSANAVL